MDDISSGCSSRCESGWTSYFDQLSYSAWSRTCVTTCDAKDVYKNEEHEDGEEEEEEDLSMVSDASSGPPNLEEYDSKAHGYRHLSAVTEEAKKSNQKSNPKEPLSRKQQNPCLEDTASSPVSPQNESTPDAQESVFSAAYFKAETSSSSRKHFGFSKPSKGKSAGAFLGMNKSQ